MSTDLVKASDSLVSAAHRCFTLGAYDDVVRLSEDAATLARSAGDRARELDADFLSARAHCQLGMPHEADATLLRIRERLSPELPEAFRDRILASSLYVAIELGDYERANEISASNTTQDPFETFRLLGYRGNLARALGDVATARASYEKAIRGLAACGGYDNTFQFVFEMDRAILDLLEGRPDDAYRVLVEVRRAIDGLEHASSSFTCIVDHYASLAATMLDLRSKGSSSLWRGDDTPRLELLAAVRDALAKGTTRRSKAAALENLRSLEAQLASWDHGRLSVRIARRALGAKLPRPVLARIVLSDDGVEVIRGHEHVFVALAKRPTLVRIVAAVVEARGQSVPADTLIASAWPSERIVPHAARNRLHVALSTLRSLGLGDLIVRREGGYALAEGARSSRL